MRAKEAAPATSRNVPPSSHAAGLGARFPGFLTVQPFPGLVARISGETVGASNRRGLTKPASRSQPLISGNEKVSVPAIVEFCLTVSHLN
jgi:hypothetical protein